MQCIFQDETKVKLFSQIQKNLLLLDPNADDKNLDEIITQIPANYLTNKEDLMVICKIFAMYSRNSLKSSKKNSIKLFEKIMDPIKTHLQDQSSFLWDIFGGLYYFKLWMYEEGLISIDFIIQNCVLSSFYEITEYFLPEILEKRPEIYYEQLIYQFKNPPTKDQIDEIKNTRKKYYKFLIDNCDYNDQIYDEIEKDPLRLSIKRDDIDTFQKIISNTNLSIDSKVINSSIDNHRRFIIEIPLIQYAIEFNATKIYHFLMMNNAKIDESMISSAIFSLDYDMIHYFESKMNDKFVVYTFMSSIANLNSDLTEYIFNNYNTFNFLQQENPVIEDLHLLHEIICTTFSQYNFIFFESILLPFLKKNEKIVNDNINEIILLTFSDSSCFFTREFLRSSKFDINYYSKLYDCSFIGEAIEFQNTNGIEILTNYPNFDVNKPSIERFPPLIQAIISYSDIKILELLTSNKHKENIDLDLRDNDHNISAFEMAVLRGNFYAIKFFNDISYVYKYSNEYGLFTYFVAVIKGKGFMAVREFLNYAMKNLERKKLENLYSYVLGTDIISNDLEKFKKIFKEITNF